MSVILAYDGRPQTKNALRFAVDYARMAKLPLYIFTSVSSINLVENEAEFAKIKEHMKEAEDMARKAGVEAHPIIEPGHPGENILAAAERFGCDVIVAGRSGKTVLDRVVLGSVSQHLVDHAKCTVVISH